MPFSFPDKIQRNIPTAIVQTRICGGALVTPNIVLTAAHCGNIKNQQVNVGAYGFRSATNDSEARFCEQWIPDPRYDTLNPNPPNNYDFALCKLDQPVSKRMENNTDTNDARRIRLELNRDNSIPVDGEILEVMGMGYDKFNNTVKQFPDFLQYISLPSVNNTVCTNIWDVPKYQDRFDTEVVFDERIQLCAGYVGVEGRDVCQGDSGSPLVQRTIQPDGTIVDIHVGLVSYGTLCAQGLPSVYARTSSGIDWIETTICDTLQSVAPFCNTSENSNNNDNDMSLDSDCDGNLLTIEVTTDANGYETSWTIVEDSTNTKILERKYLLNNYKNEHTLCLDNSKSERYTWTIRDEGADGMCTPKGCGSYSVRLDGKLLFSGDGTSFQSSRTETFCIDSPSKSPPDISCQIAPTPNPTPKPPVSSPTNDLKSLGLCGFLAS